MSPQKQIVKNLKRLRRKAGMSQAQVAEKAEIHVNYYARIERGETNPSLETLEAIAKALKVKAYSTFQVETTFRWKPVAYEFLHKGSQKPLIFPIPLNYS